MSREAKQLERLRDFQRDQGWDFAELCGLLQRLGFEMRVSGSHHFFRRPGMLDVINLQPQSGRAKPYQVRQIRKTLEANGML
jgi:predicted RNA binding protein YcfA (HicA-like mRNA interferase family)